MISGRLIVISLPAIRQNQLLVRPRHCLPWSGQNCGRFKLKPHSPLAAAAPFVSPPPVDRVSADGSAIATNSALISVSSKPIHLQETDVKSFILATALLLPSMALAQDAAAPAAKPPVAQAPKPKRVAAPVHAAAKPAPSANEVLDVNQIIGIRQIDPATYEIDARLQSGGEIHLRMNAFVMQGLGMQLGTYGKAPGG
jgi:hypothetical protein